MINVIVAFSRPNYLKNIINNFLKQKYKDKKLIIVENGSAIGTCKNNNFKPDILLTSNNHQSYAKNEALNYLKKHNGGWWTTFDDDDYYGPNYLNKISDALNKADVIGQSDIFIRTQAKTIRLFSNLTDSNNTMNLHGSTITARAEDCPFFPKTDIWGEDFAFLNNYQQMGAKGWATSPYGHLLYRHKKNTWNINDSQLVKEFSFASSNNVIIKDYGVETSEKLGIINGDYEGDYKIIKCDSNYEPEDSISYLELVKKTESISDFSKKFLNN